MSETALIIIDMQNDFVLEDAPMRSDGALEIVPKVKEVLDAFRMHKLPVFHVSREYRVDGSDIEHTRLEAFKNQKYCLPGTKGSDIIDELYPIDGEFRIVKKRFSGFMNTELDLMLRRLSIKKIVVCGIQYPNCIRATVFDGIALGYDVTLLTDATAAKTPEVAQANIFDMQNIGVACISVHHFLGHCR